MTRPTEVPALLPGGTLSSVALTLAASGGQPSAVETCLPVLKAT
jgi:hypothetical protein